MYVLLHMGVLRLGGQKKLLRGLSFYSPPFPLRQDISLSGVQIFSVNSLRYPPASTFLRTWVWSVCGPLASSLGVGI